MTEPDYDAMPREELVRRLRHAREWGRKMLDANRETAARCGGLVAEVALLKEQVAELEKEVGKLESKIERAGEVLSSVLDEIEIGMWGDEIDGFEFGQRIRDEIGNKLPLNSIYDAD